MKNARWSPAVALLLAVAGCSSTTAGVPLPNRAAEADVKAAATLKVTDPCSLLSDAEVRQHGLVDREDGPFAGARECSWTHPSNEDGLYGYAVGPAIWDQQGLADANTAGYTVSDHPIGRHSGQQLKPNLGDSCLIIIGVSRSTRVDMIVAGGPETPECQVADEYARLAEARLP